jgi:hypothetical protein
MKHWLVLAALGVAALSGAQSTAIGEPTDLAFRVGGAYPFDSATRDETGSSLIGIGADYFIKESLFKNGESFLSFDWLGKSASGAHGNLFPVMLNQRFYMKDTGEVGSGRTYFFLGAGVAFVDVFTAKAVPAIRGGVGKEFGPHIFGEATVVLSDAANGARANTVGAYIGYRF